MTRVIETKGITKKYGNLEAVSKVSIHVSKGEIYGFLGLNGAGKTTMIRMLLGMIKPSEGEAYIHNKKVDSRNNGAWNHVGCMVETPYAYPELTVFENLEIVRKIREIKDPAPTNEIIEKLNLGEYRNKKVRDLSLGNKQRLGLAKALIHNPEILILDEPTNGLDPAGIVEIRNLLLDLAQNRGATILISSHLLTEISKIADRIGIIHKGKLVTELNSEAFEVDCHKKVILNTTNNSLAKELLVLNGYGIEEDNFQLISYDSEAVQHPENLSEILTKHQIYLKKIDVDVENLESYFLRIIGEGDAAL